MPRRPATLIHGDGRLANGSSTLRLSRPSIFRSSLSLLHHVLTSALTTSPPPQLIFSFFKTLTGHPVTIELKNDVAITGTLKSVDQFLNFRIENLRVVGNEEAEDAAAAAAGVGMNGEGAENGTGAVGEAIKGARWPHLVSSNARGQAVDGKGGADMR